MFFSKKPKRTKATSEAVDPEKKARAAADRRTWEDAETALMAFKVSRSNQDRELAAGLLMNVMQREVKHIIHNGVKVDQKLPAAFRRDIDEMGRDAVASVLSKERTRMSVLADQHEPDTASLRTFIARLLYNKVVDYTRKEPVFGELNNGDTPHKDQPPSELRQFSQSLLPPETKPQTASSTLVPPEQLSGVKQAKAMADALASETIQDDHETPELIRQFKAFLNPDEFDIFVCQFEGVSDVDGLAYLCQKYGEKINAQGQPVPYMTIGTYGRKRDAMRKALQQRFPEIKW